MQGSCASAKNALAEFLERGSGGVILRLMTRGFRSCVLLLTSLCPGVRLSCSSGKAGASVVQVNLYCALTCFKSAGPRRTVPKGGAFCNAQVEIESLLPSDAKGSDTVASIKEP